MFKCSVCGYIHDGTEAPAKCPKCGSDKEKFEKVPDEAQAVIEKARFTNDLHVHMLTVLQEIEVLSHDGIQADLDPACVAIFQKCKTFADETARAVKAELAGHIKKEKWG